MDVDDAMCFGVLHLSTCKLKASATDTNCRLGIAVEGFWCGEVNRVGLIAIMVGTDLKPDGIEYQLTAEQARALAQLLLEAAKFADPG